MTPLLLFFVLTFIISWIFFISAAAFSGATAPSSGPAMVSTFVRLVGVFAPALVALMLTARAEGRAGIRALLRRVGEFPSGARWYVFAFGFMAAIKLSAAILHRVIAGAWPPFGQDSLVLMLAATIFSTPSQAGEEIGWRGYALPRLAARLGVAPASLVLGVIWAVWHLPFFLMPGGDTYRQSFIAYLTSVIALSVALAFLYWRTNGSLLMTMLMHAAINNTKDIVPSAEAVATSPFTLSASLMAWLTAALLWICAIYFLFRMRDGTLRTDGSGSGGGGADGKNRHRMLQTEAG